MVCCYDIMFTTAYINHKFMLLIRNKSPYIYFLFNNIIYLSVPSQNFSDSIYLSSEKLFSIYIHIQLLFICYPLLLTLFFSFFSNMIFKGIKTFSVLSFDTLEGAWMLFKSTEIVRFNHLRANYRSCYLAAIVWTSNIYVFHTEISNSK